MKHTSILPLVLLVSFSGCVVRVTESEAPPNRLRPAEVSAGWKLLFDGETTRGWRGYRKDTMPAGWEVVDGALTRTGSGGDVITLEQFASFELALEWKISEGGNSGIFFHGTEARNAVYETAPEYQVLDNSVHRDGGDPRTSAGANYALHAPAADYTRPAGEWNEARISVHGDHVTHWLNGQRILEYELGSEAWKKLVAESKFAAWPEYGTAGSGHIALQDHGDEVAYRNIKILPLTE